MSKLLQMIQSVIEYTNPIIDIDEKNKRVMLREGYLFTSLVAKHYQTKGYLTIED